MKDAMLSRTAKQTANTPSVIADWATIVSAPWRPSAMRHASMASRDNMLSNPRRLPK
ncbi:hypothetical protein SISNIDRAFT_460362 [Sistotremastrum niveocremeum HHB9708]|uniref:Uncharacterized protein n=1 Tax=Sistotremastrum niveocremeum HHB9708 TaxID=1314777 RepID=A0A164NPT9_9AGAM|nr:hypothetical protein SISNIDRAFT_460338 [Sistotremastrum niveocremeum HHB9708]KZS87914.1 hypothetical protein SISNIDRAFT_460362 [Sistotremastrum niveocremeum HHB9708]